MISLENRNTSRNFLYIFSFLWYFKIMSLAFLRHSMPKKTSEFDTRTSIIKSLEILHTHVISLLNRNARSIFCDFSIKRNVLDLVYIINNNRTLTKFVVDDLVNLSGIKI